MRRSSLSSDLKHQNLVAAIKINGFSLEVETVYPIYRKYEKDHSSYFDVFFSSFFVLVCFGP